MERNGQPCQTVPEESIGKAPWDWGHVQAAELKVKTQPGTLWLALADCGPFRLGLGGVLSHERDLSLMRARALRVFSLAVCRPLRLAADGLASDGRAFQEAFRWPLPRTAPGRPKVRAWATMAIGQVVKHRADGVLPIQRRIVQGSTDWVQPWLDRTQAGGPLNTASIERLNGTFRQGLAALTRRGRMLARLPQPLSYGMCLVGTVYNVWSYPDRLAVEWLIAPQRRRWLRRTPAIAAGLTDHRWSGQDRLTFKIPPPPFVPPKRLARPPKLKSSL